MRDEFAFMRDFSPAVLFNYVKNDLQESDMSSKKVILMALFLLLAAGTRGADRTIDPTRVPVGPMKIVGFVTINNSPGSQRLFMSAAAWKGGVEAAGGVMKLMGQKLAPVLNGYRGSKFDTAVRSGDRITATFQPPWAGLPLYTAALAAPTMINFSSPANNAHVAVGGAGSLDIIWSGGTPPCRLSIYRIGDNAMVFARDGIAVGRVSVPLRTFNAGKRYTIIVEDGNRKFTWDPAVDPASELLLRQTADIFFYAD